MLGSCGRATTESCTRDSVVVRAQLKSNSKYAISLEDNVNKFIFMCGLLALACGGGSDGGDTSAATGSEGEACYPNGTCDGGLSCLSKRCVATGTGGAPGAAGSAPSNTAGASPITAGAGPVGGGGAGPAAGGASGGATSTPTCTHKNLTNSTAPEKVNAAFCVGLGFSDNYACQFYPSSDETRCIGSTTSYVVSYSETSNGTRGDIYDLSNNEHFGVLDQSLTTGAYEIYLDNGATASCAVNGDVATFCTP